jgi:hypothetical protein
MSKCLMVIERNLIKKSKKMWTWCHVLRSINCANSQIYSALGCNLFLHSLGNLILFHVFFNTHTYMYLLYVYIKVSFLFKVNWDSERECFDSFARETCDFYSTKKSMFQKTQKSDGCQVGLLIIHLYCFCW